MTVKERELHQRHRRPKVHHHSALWLAQQEVVDLPADCLPWPYPFSLCLSVSLTFGAPLISIVLLFHRPFCQYSTFLFRVVVINSECVYLWCSTAKQKALFAFCLTAVPPPRRKSFVCDCERCQSDGPLFDVFGGALVFHLCVSVCQKQTDRLSFLLSLFCSRLHWRYPLLNQLSDTCRLFVDGDFYLRLGWALFSSVWNGAFQRYVHFPFYWYLSWNAEWLYI